MGLTCKPIGKNRSVMKKLQNRLDAEAKDREEVKRKRKKKKKIKSNKLVVAEIGRRLGSKTDNGKPSFLLRSCKVQILTHQSGWVAPIYVSV